MAELTGPPASGPAQLPDSLRKREITATNESLGTTWAWELHFASGDLLGSELILDGGTGQVLDSIRRRVPTPCSSIVST
ncbi:hypothetical protein [Streptomyces sp. NPDC048637]|uniref:hypothetical protein n=1 Tax=Streptomyces sp. NPDC048637 TaxID=3155636 RepID=UPI00341F7A08